jgi:hypothetical protein
VIAVHRRGFLGRLWTRQPDPSRIGRLVAVAVGLAAMGLVPWMVYLGLTLPHRYLAANWSLLWIGFDVTECVVLASIAWMTWKHRRMMGEMALVAGTLLLSDAWFDVITSWGGQGSWFTLMTAVVVELPLAVFMYWLAYRAIRRSRAVAVSPLGRFESVASPVHQSPLAPSRSQAIPRTRPVRSPDRLIAEVRALSSELHDALVELSRTAIDGGTDRGATVHVHDAVEEALEDILLVPPIDADASQALGSSPRLPCERTAHRRSADVTRPRRSHVEAVFDR